MIKTQLLFILLTISLSGCQANDPRPPIIWAELSVVNNKICVAVVPEGDEKVVSIRIDEAGNEKEKFLEKNLLNLSARAGQCMPDFGFNFISGRGYHFTVVLESQEKKLSGTNPYVRIFNANFNFISSNGTIEAERFY